MLEASPGRKFGRTAASSSAAIVTCMLRGRLTPRTTRINRNTLKNSLYPFLFPPQVTHELIHGGVVNTGILKVENTRDHPARLHQPGQKDGETQHRRPEAARTNRDVLVPGYILRPSTDASHGPTPSTPRIHTDDGVCAPAGMPHPTHTNKGEVVPRMGLAEHERAGKSGFAEEGRPVIRPSARQTACDPAPLVGIFRSEGGRSPAFGAGCRAAVGSRVSSGGCIFLVFGYRVYQARRAFWLVRGGKTAGVYPRSERTSLARG